MHNRYAFSNDIKKTSFLISLNPMFLILILSIIQGVTEFIPVSSSSHLILISEYLNYEKSKLSIDVSLHIGSFIAVLTFFYKDIINFVENKLLFIKIFISSLPIMVVGFLLVKTGMIDNLRSIKIIGWMTIIFGIMLYISDKFKLKKNINENFTYKSAFIIGLFQVLSLVPGVSRSGVSLTAARLLNFKRFDAAKISFLLSIPTLAVVSLYGLTNIYSNSTNSFSFLNVLSILLSFIFSLITIKYFLKYTKRFNLNIFVIYRIILGSIILLTTYL